MCSFPQLPFLLPPSSFTTWEAGLLLVFLLSFLVQLGYGIFYGKALSNLQKVGEGAKAELQNPVSVVIAAHNEAKMLPILLPSLVEQQYGNFEVVVVDDRSSDGTSEILHGWQQKYPELIRLVHIRKVVDGVNPKKAALLAGIARAKNQVLLLTDADCRPLSRHWIQLMQRHCQGATALVVGIGRYRKRRGFLNLFIRFETFCTAWQYITFTLMGLPYMGVGRNLCYTKALFERVGGFSGFLGVMGGDDDLFVQKAANATKVGISLQLEAQTESEPYHTFQKWASQKIRHLSVGKRYSRRISMWLALFHASHVAFHFIFIIALVKVHFLSLILIYIFRLALYWFVAKKIAQAVSAEKDILLAFPLLDILFAGYFLLFGLLAVFNKRTKWI